MPKIIENLPERLLNEAKRQIEEAGYSAMTVRSVAKGCGVGVGTVYNYYRSKEEMVASFLLADWKQCVETISACAEAASDKEPVLRAIQSQLVEFARRNMSVFADESAAVGFSGSRGIYHGMLRSQLASPLRKFCPDDFTAEFVAEAMLTWTMAGKSFDELADVLKKLF